MQMPSEERHALAMSPGSPRTVALPRERPRRHQCHRRPRLPARSPAVRGTRRRSGADEARDHPVVFPRSCGRDPFAPDLPACPVSPAMGRWPQASPLQRVAGRSAKGRSARAAPRRHQSPSRPTELDRSRFRPGRGKTESRCRGPRHGARPAPPRSAGRGLLPNRPGLPTVIGSARPGLPRRTGKGGNAARRCPSPGRPPVLSVERHLWTPRAQSSRPHRCHPSASPPPGVCSDRP